MRKEALHYISILPDNILLAYSLQHRNRSIQFMCKDTVSSRLVCFLESNQFMVDTIQKKANKKLVIRVTGVIRKWTSGTCRHPHM